MSGFGCVGSGGLDPTRFAHLLSVGPVNLSPAHPPDPLFPLHFGLGHGRTGNGGGGKIDGAKGDDDGGLSRRGWSAMLPRKARRGVVDEEGDDCSDRGGGGS